MATKRNTSERDGTRVVKHGSDEHAALLGLKKADKDDGLQIDGWTLVDVTAFGPQATENYIREVLRQKVSELKAGPPEVPPNAPEIWWPVDDPPPGFEGRVPAALQED
jgi:hypothetical protein